MLNLYVEGKVADKYQNFQENNAQSLGHLLPLCHEFPGLEEAQSDCTWNKWAAEVKPSRER